MACPLKPGQIWQIARTHNKFIIGMPYRGDTTFGRYWMGSQHQISMELHGEAFTNTAGWGGTLQFRNQVNGVVKVTDVSEGNVDLVTLLYCPTWGLG
jgi:hypothetical protein